MKTLLKVFQTMAILGFIFVFMSMTGNQVMAASVTISAGVFSGIVHTSNHFKNIALTAPVVPDFTKKTKTEIKALTDDEYDAYLDEVKAFDEATLNKRFYDMEQAIKEKGDDDSEKQITELKTKLDAAINELDQMFLMIKGINEKPKEGEGYKTLGEAMLAGFMEKKDELEDWAKTGKRDVNKGPIEIRVTTKAVVDIGEENTIGAGATEVTLTENTNIISPIRKRELRYMSNVSVGRIGSARALWIEETTEEGTPIMIGEGDTKTQLSVLYVEQTRSVKKIAVFSKVTTELLADLPQLVSFIQNNILKRMDIVVEDQLFSGDGIGDNLTGSITEATAFTGGSLALDVDDANEADVIEAIALQAEEAFHIPNAVFMHPSKISKIKTLKASDGHYLFPEFRNDNTTPISNMRVISTLALGADVFLGGDLTVIQALIRSELGIQIGLDGNDFTQNKQTMLAEKRLVQFISANDTAGLITGTFTAAKAALETV